MQPMTLAQDTSALEERVRALESANQGRPLAVVAGTSINALGVVRSLGIQGIPAVWLTSNPHSFVNASRYASCLVTCEDVFYDGFVPALLKLAPSFSTPPVLFLTHDFQVKKASEAKDALSEHYRFDLPAREVVDSMLSKSGFARLALESSLPVPGTHLVHNPQELADVMQRCASEGTWVVKPFEKSDAFEERFGKATKIASADEWQRFASLYGNLDVPILIQSWVVGPDSSIAFCLVVFDSGGRCLASFEGKKIRQYKPEIGNTASAERFPSEEIARDTVRFFERFGFVGMGSLEFKYNDASQRFEAIEPTIGRTNLQSEVAVINGCNLPAIYYYGLTGDTENLQKSVKAASASSSDRVWMRFGADFKASWYFIRRGQLTLAEWIRPFGKSVYYSVFRFRDPYPFLHLAGKSVVSLIKRTLRSCWNSVAPRRS